MCYVSCLWVRLDVGGDFITNRSVHLVDGQDFDHRFFCCTNTHSQLESFEKGMLPLFFFKFFFFKKEIILCLYSDIDTGHQRRHIMPFNSLLFLTIWNSFSWNLLETYETGFGQNICWFNHSGSSLSHVFTAVCYQSVFRVWDPLTLCPSGEFSSCHYRFYRRMDIYLRQKHKLYIRLITLNCP